MANERIIAFRDALSGDGVLADLVYELTDSSLAQDVVIRGRLPDPERFGLSANSYLVMVTEFHDAPSPKQGDAREGEFDRTLQWGTAGIVRGKAFSLGEGSRPTVDVQKMWVEQDGRTLLYETVPYPWVKVDLNSLPLIEGSPIDSTPFDEPEAAEQGSTKPAGSMDTLLVSLPKPVLPAFGQNRGTPAAKPLAEVAALDGPGFVLDFTLVDYPVISVDFGAGYDEKRGFAAIGRSSYDYWNVYDVENAARTNRWFKDGMSLLYTDQSLSGASVKVENTPGTWSFKHWMQSLDPAYDDYIYPTSGEATITITSLPAGSYDFFLFGHGPAENANTVFTLGTNTQSTAASGPTWSQPNWREGQHYVVFRAVEVQEGVPVTITASQGESGYAVLNALQIGRTGQLMPAPQILDILPSKTVPRGGAALLSVAASGCGPLSYQWFKDGQPLPSATNATHHVLGADTADAGAYTVQVSGAGGEVLSPELMLLLDGGGCVSAPPGIVAWWPGEYSTEDTALNHDGIWGGTQNYETAHVGQGFRIGSGRYVYAPYATGLDVGASSSYGFTIEGWIKRYDNVASPLFQWGSGSQNGVHVWINYENVGMVYANILEANGTGHGIRAANALQYTGQFAHVALTYTASSGDIKLYINGALKTTVNEGVLGPLKTALNFNLGYRPSDAKCFNGVIDEASLYNCALSPQDIYSIYTAGANGKCPIGTAPIITTAPQSQSVGLGNSVTLSVIANGTPPLTYQWERDGQIIGTSSSYQISSFDASHAGIYRVTVANAYGADTREATLTIHGGTPLPSGCIAWWRAEGNVHDSVGSSHGALFSGATYDNPGRIGQAFKFPGPTSFASAPDSSLWNFAYGGFTIEFWVKFDAWQASGSYYQPGVIFVGNDEGGGNKRKWFFALGNGLLNFHANEPNVYSEFKVLAPFTPQINKWYHLALVRSGQYVYIYKDGIRQGSGAYFPYCLANPVAALTIGQAEGLGYLKGVMDEVTIYNRGLSETDINGIYSAGSAGKCVSVDLNDPDYDGIPNSVDADPNNPNTAPHVRLAYFGFNAGLTGEGGRVPTQSSGAQSVIGWIGNAVKRTGDTLVYKAAEDNGAGNINCRQGMVRFRFAPLWSSGTGPGGAGGDLLNVGNGWRIWVDPSGSHLSFTTSDGSASTTLLTTGISWQANEWYQICLTYGPSETVLYVNGTIAATGQGVPYYPSACDRSQYGLSIGSDHAGNNVAHGIFDELETFNYNDRLRKAIVFGAAYYSRNLASEYSHASGNYSNFLLRAPEGWENWMRSEPMTARIAKREVYTDLSGDKIARLHTRIEGERPYWGWHYLKKDDQVKISGVGNAQYNTLSARITHVEDANATYWVMFKDPNNGLDTSPANQPIHLSHAFEGILYVPNSSQPKRIFAYRRYQGNITVWVHEDPRPLDINSSKVTTALLPVGFNHSDQVVINFNTAPQEAKHYIEYKATGTPEGLVFSVEQPPVPDDSGTITLHGINVCNQPNLTFIDAANSKFEICLAYSIWGRWMSSLSDAEAAMNAGLAIFVPHYDNIRERYVIAGLQSPPSGLMPVGGGYWSPTAPSSSELSFGPELEFVDAINQEPSTIPDCTESWAHAASAAKYAKLKDLHPEWNAYDLRQLLRQTSTRFGTTPGWTEKHGYGWPQIRTKVTSEKPNGVGMPGSFVEAPIDVGLSTLSAGDPLEIKYTTSPDGKTVSFTWKKFRQTGFEPGGVTIIDGPENWYTGSAESASWTTNYDLRNPPTEVTFRTRLTNGRTSAGLKFKICAELQMLVVGEQTGLMSDVVDSGYSCVQQVGVPFTITINAVDQARNVLDTLKGDMVKISTTDEDVVFSPTDVVPLVNGTASLTVTFRTPGKHTITATGISGMTKSASISTIISVTP